jgi:hypothetical protein
MVRELLYILPPLQCAALPGVSLAPQLLELLTASPSIVTPIATRGVLGEDMRHMACGEAFKAGLMLTQKGSPDSGREDRSGVEARSWRTGLGRQHTTCVTDGSAGNE